MSDPARTTFFRIERHGRLTKLMQGQSSKGLPQCINCNKTIPRSNRRWHAVGKKPSYFCKDACAIGFAWTVARDTYSPLTWTEPPEQNRRKLRQVAMLVKGDLIDRKGTKCIVLDLRYAGRGKTVLFLQPVIMKGERPCDQTPLKVVVDSGLNIAWLGHPGLPEEEPQPETCP